MDLTYSLRLGAKPKPMEQDEAAVEKLRYELFFSFCFGWVQATVSTRLLRQLSPEKGWGGVGRERGRRQGAGKSSTWHNLVLDKPALKQKTRQDQGKQDIGLPSLIH